MPLARRGFRFMPQNEVGVCTREHHRALFLHYSHIHVAIAYYLIPSASYYPDALPFILVGNLLVISTVCRYDASERQPITHPVQISSSPLPRENPSLTSYFTSRDYYLCVGLSMHAYLRCWLATAQTRAACWILVCILSQSRTRHA